MGYLLDRSGLHSARQFLGTTHLSPEPILQPASRFACSKAPSPVSPTISTHRRCCALQREEPESPGIPRGGKAHSLTRLKHDSPRLLRYVRWTCATSVAAPRQEGGGEGSSR